MGRGLAGTLVAVALGLPATAQAADYHVVVTGDTPVGGLCPGPATCSLREAVTSANASAGPDRILVPPGTYPLVNGELDVTDEVVIERDGSSGTVTIDAGGLSHVVWINSTGPTTLRGLTITGGHGVGIPTTATGAGITAFSDLALDDVTVTANTAEAAGGALGAGIYTTANLTTTGTVVVTDNHTIAAGSAIARGGGIFIDVGGSADLDGVVLRDNSVTTESAAAEGGGIAANTSGTVAISGATIDANRSVLNGPPPGGADAASGGGLAMTGSGTLTLTDSRVTNNVAESANLAQGGGALVAGTVVIAGTTFAANTALSHSTSPVYGALGGGVALRASGTSITNATFTGNAATTTAPTGGLTYGGAIFASSGPLTFAATTISGNTAHHAGGGGDGGGLYAGTPTTATGSIVSANAQDTGTDCAGGGTVTSGGGNVLPTAAGCAIAPLPTDLLSDAPGLLALADHGGPAPTMLLSASSPALDRYTTGCPATDERGIVRPQGAACDAGAVEMRAGDFPPPAPPAGAASALTCGDLDLRTAFATPAAARLDCHGGVWTWAIVTPPTHGTLSAIGPTGALTYTPDDGFSGEDRFRYVAQGAAGRSAPATAIVHVDARRAAAADPPASTPVRACTPRTVTIRLNPRGVRFTSARVTVDGATVTPRRTRTVWKATFTLKGAPGEQTTVRISGRRTDGRLVTTSRTLTAC
jgi:hypothetical protein